ncbi:MAG: response regulator transcription factor [Kofleriaceae bacterium]|nr:response regulator transcription factor [Kofleriaceae bacterium]
MGERVLLIEDDRELGGQIVTTLTRAGFAVTWWKEGRVPDPEQLDLMIVDLMLPGIYGLEILRAVRETSDVPVLVLSARNDTTTKVRSLKLGADDYMTKPFWPEELVERVRARLRRPLLARTEFLELGPIRISLSERVVTVAGAAVELTRAEFELLSTLARRRGAAVTRAALVEAALDADRDNAERTLDVHMSRLRKKLGDPNLIQTVWGIGYRLAAGPGT